MTLIVVTLDAGEHGRWSPEVPLTMPGRLVDVGIKGSPVRGQIVGAVLDLDDGRWLDLHVQVLPVN